MQNNIINFNYDNNQVRTQLVNNEPYFCLKDVCEILHIRNSRDILSRLSLEGVVLTDGVSLTTNQYGKTTEQKTKLNFINEPNLYRVIFRSDKPEAKQFQNWVFEEVLPTLRKTGSYDLNNNTELNNSNNNLLTYNLKTRIFNRNKLRYSFVEDIPYFLDADIFELFEMREPNKTMKDLDIIRKCLSINKLYLGLNISQIIEIIAYLKNERSSLFLTVLQNNIIPYFDTLPLNNNLINNNSIVRII